VKFEPKPTQAPLPIVFGGESEPALRRAAALGDGWYGVGHTPESAAVQVAKLRTLRAEAGGAGPPLGRTAGPGGGALSREDVRRCEAAGAAGVVALPGRRGREAEEALGRLAEAVPPAA